MTLLRRLPSLETHLCEEKMLTVSSIKVGNAWLADGGGVWAPPRPAIVR